MYLLSSYVETCVASVLLELPVGYSVVSLGLQIWDPTVCHGDNMYDFLSRNYTVTRQRMKNQLYCRLVMVGQVITRGAPKRFYVETCVASVSVQGCFFVVNWTTNLRSYVTDANAWRIINFRRWWWSVIIRGAPMRHRRSTDNHLSLQQRRPAVGLQ